ncbi:MAG: hypothetical protein IMF14_08590 [Proteobacteria bacterium]|nr:hypothetical protein [Pseudomonadota bacterium]
MTAFVISLMTGTASPPFDSNTVKLMILSSMKDDVDELEPGIPPII